MVGRRRDEHEETYPGTGVAPTPYNTYLSTTDAGESSFGGVEAVPEGHGGRASVSFGPSVSYASAPSQNASTATAPAHSTSRLIDHTVSIIPQSDLPVPGPPSRLSSTDTKSSPIPSTSASAAGSGKESPEWSSTGSSGQPRSGGSKWSWRGRRKRQNEEMTQDDRDAARLQQLGYDAVLGREYNFWSSLAITTLNIGALQVSRTFWISHNLQPGQED